MTKSKIEWTDEVLNPFTGCSKISAGCANCYAEKFANRLMNNPKVQAKYKNGFKPTYHHYEMLKVYKWKNPRRVFVCSMSDMFHEDNKFEEILTVLFHISENPMHTFIVLTKRAKRMKEFFDWMAMGTPDKSIPGGKFLPNLWLGVTTENQETFNERVPILLDIPAAVHFVSCEPLLSAIDFTIKDPDYMLHSLSGDFICAGMNDMVKATNKIDWVIVGGETGKNSRPMDPKWAVQIMNQCKEHKVPFFFKSWGDYNAILKTFYSNKKPTGSSIEFIKVGKKKAGNILSGQIYEEFPDAKRICYKSNEICKYDCRGLCKESC